MKIIVFDTETTGFPSPTLPLEKQPYICQFASLTVDVDMQNRKIKPVRQVDQLLKPEVAIPYECTQVHKISDEMVVNKPTFKEWSDKLLEIFHEADVAVAHNISFDQKIIENELERVGKAKNFLPSQTFDTMVETKELCMLPGKNGNFKSPRLEELYQFLFQKNFSGAHNAMNDVMATFYCARELMTRGVFQPKEPSQGTLF